MVENLGRFTDSDLLTMYTQMVRIRRFEERLAELVDGGEVKTPCHLYIGQEAIAVGVCTSLEREDAVWGGHRSHGHYLAKGGDMKLMLAEIFGKKTGCAEGRGGSMHLQAASVGIWGTVPLVSATIPLAVGFGLASKLKGNTDVSVSFLGDGATEEGHFHESLNLAAIYRLPVVFICENNFYASHLSLTERRTANKLHLIATSQGVPGSEVDGNDVLAVWTSFQEALHRARSGMGPTFIECKTYRWRGHVGASWDEDVGVKRKDELGTWLRKDPIKRLEGVLAEFGRMPTELSKVEAAVAHEVEDAVKFARESPYPPASDLNKHVYFVTEA